MKPGFVVVGVLTVGGCGSVEAQLSCTSQFAAYVEAWSCIRARQAVGFGGMTYNDLGAHYIAKGNALAEQVQAGQLTDRQAKNILDMELVHRNGISQQRLVNGLRPVPTFSGYYDYYYYFY
ncbi:hypothetical protein [Microvirga alba]|uniref:Lipoprotein n=1 Tax=Microvirga alba TaxID=2791025 RepID=A0A931BQD1_9HYPH|nr:hypothetical protein [Microvirga alba]MBF9234118.1 hypothetical protein [Microvirga alba]